MCLQQCSAAGVLELGASLSCFVPLLWGSATRHGAALASWLAGAACCGSCGCIGRILGHTAAVSEHTCIILPHAPSRLSGAAAAAAGGSSCA